MTRKRWKLVAYVLLAANICFIWGNSALPGSASQEISGDIMNWVGFLLRAFGEYGEKILRKIAHLAEFASLGLLLSLLFRMEGNKSYTPPLLLGLTIACVDETIQIFSPGRASSLIDVWIDMSGVVSGIILLIIGHAIFRKKVKKHLEDKRL